MPKLNIVEIANAIATLILVIILTWVKLRERKLTGKMGLDNNPERCVQHQTKIAVIEERLDTIEEDIKEIKDKFK